MTGYQRTPKRTKISFEKCFWEYSFYPLHTKKTFLTNKLIRSLREYLLDSSWFCVSWACSCACQESLIPSRYGNCPDRPRRCRPLRSAWRAQSWNAASAASRLLPGTRYCTPATCGQNHLNEWINEWMNEWMNAASTASRLAVYQVNINNINLNLLTLS